MLEINLFYEQQQLQRERDFDPVRLTLTGGFCILMLITIWGLIIYLRMGELRAGLASQNAELKKLTKEFADLGQLTDFPKIQSEAKSLENRVANRTFFATQLDILRDAVPTNFQVRSFKTGRALKTTETVIQGKKGSFTIKKAMPMLDLMVEVQARAKDKVGVLQMRDSLIDSLRRDTRLRDWAKQVPDETEKANWNEVDAVSSVAQDPKAGEPAIGLFELRIPIALKDEPKEM